VTGAVVFDSRRLNLSQIVTAAFCAERHASRAWNRAAGPSVVALSDLVTGEQRWRTKRCSSRPSPRRGLRRLDAGLQRTAAEGSALEVLQAGPDMIVIYTMMGLRAWTRDRRSSMVRSTAHGKPMGQSPRHVRLYPSLNKTDRIYVSF